MPDAGASVLAAIFHVNEATVEMASAMAFPILLVIGKVLGPLIGFAFWPIRKAETLCKSDTGGGKHPGKQHHFGSGEIIDFPLAGKERQATSNILSGKLSCKLSSETAEASGKATHDAGGEIIDFPGKGEAFPTAADDGNLSDNAFPRKLSKRDEAFADLRKVMAQSGDVPSQRTLSNRWRVSEGTVSKWCKHWESSGKVCRRKNGKCQEVLEGFASFASLHEAGTA
jgi:hypothetical protein